MFELVVKEPFRLDGTRYAKGDLITDPVLVGKVILSHLERHVVKRARKET